MDEDFFSYLGEFEEELGDKELDEIIYFRENKEKYEEFANRLKWIIEIMLKEEKIKFQTICARIKDESSILTKVKKKKLSVKEMQDIVGIRIVTYLESDSKKIAQLIEKEFNIDKRLTKNHSEILKIDQVGYRGKNFVASVNQHRQDDIIWKNYSSIKFEIQVHTLLEYAWSEIQHDRNYKFSGELPQEIARKFSLLAGSLELLDLNFDELCKKVDYYEENIKKRIQNGDKKEEINSLSITVYLSLKFEEQIKKKIVTPRYYKSKFVIQAVKDMGIYNLEELEIALNSIPLNEYLDCQTNIDFSDLIRDLLLIKFKEIFLDKGLEKKWDYIYKDISYNEKEFIFFSKQGIDLINLSKLRDLNWTVREDEPNKKQKRENEK